MDITESREFAARLADLLQNERFAMADFLVALAEFDRRRGWIELGYSSLFSFLVHRLELSKAAAFFRNKAAELIQRCPEILEPLRDGRICITTVASLARVLTQENRAEVLPRFFHRSKQEAKAIAAQLLPDPTPPRRTVVTTVELATGGERRATEETSSQAVFLGKLEVADCSTNRSVPAQTSRTDPSLPVPTRPLRAEPLTATETRLHLTVSAAFLKKLEAARLALSHAMPGATEEDVLTAGLDLILARDAKRKAQLRTPAKRRATPPPASEAGPSSDGIPAAVRREVWARDQGRCQYPLDGGGVCGSELRTELDHIHPKSLGGKPVAGNLRVTCEFHNQLAAREQLGDVVMDAYARNPRRVATVRDHPA